MLSTCVGPLGFGNSITQFWRVEGSADGHQHLREQTLGRQFSLDHPVVGAHSCGGSFGSIRIADR
jgi:hypothetical protein